MQNCRGQSYDNASMSGRYTGLQARVKAVAPYAEYAPCSAHSLNLAGARAASCCVAATGFFGFLQKLYTFCSASTHRWNSIIPTVSCTPKEIAATRWSARADAAQALRVNYCNIRESLPTIAEDPDENNMTKVDARSLAKKLAKFETAVLTVVLHTILTRVNRNSLLLQSKDCTLATCAKIYDSLSAWLDTIRPQFDIYEDEAKTLVENGTYKEIRGRHVQSAKESFRTSVFCAIIDNLAAELNRRKVVYADLNQRFSVLVEWNDADGNAIRRMANTLQQAYPDDLDDDFANEIEQCVVYAVFL